MACTCNTTDWCECWSTGEPCDYCRNRTCPRHSEVAKTLKFRAEARARDLARRGTTCTVGACKLPAVADRRCAAHRYANNGD